MSVDGPEAPRRVALVTGASKGMGRAIALGLAKRGCRVCVVARTEDTLNAAAEAIRNETHQEIWAVAADVSQPEVPSSVVAGVIERWGGVDILVNNAGGPPPGSFLDHDEAAWAQTLNQTFLSVVRFSRAVAPGMKTRGWGRIITVSSTVAKEPSPAMVLSASARAAVSAFTKAIASELAPFGITANVLLPGGVQTERLESLVRAGAEKDGLTFEQGIARSVAMIPAGRFATPEEFANVAVFLASDEGRYVTGVSLAVDGGLTRSVF
jgi:3-oxoacyl-[acyl-carrier protein] reductase